MTLSGKTPLECSRMWNQCRDPDLLTFLSGFPTMCWPEIWLGEKEKSLIPSSDLLSSSHWIFLMGKNWLLSSQSTLGTEPVSHWQHTGKTNSSHFLTFFLRRLLCSDFMHISLFLKKDTNPLFSNGPRKPSIWD